MKTFATDKLYFIPLGGCGIFGANFSLYGYGGKWIAVDCGMGFGDDTMPGVDIIVPDIEFIKEIKDDILGLIITHGHEDHIGSLEHLWPQLKLPLYATPFTEGLIREKLQDKKWASKVEYHPLNEGDDIRLDPFTISAIPMAHSIPEMRALKIAVNGLGSVLHTGDWKLDADPVTGDRTNETALRALGEAGDVLALVGDSTNAMVPGHSGSEADVLKHMTELFSEFNTRVIVSCFSSNVARLVSIAKAAAANDRQVSLVGRSLWRIDRVARAAGYLDDVAPFIDAEEAMRLPRHKVVYACTGSQGESRAALARIANKDHRFVRIEGGDVVMFSSRAIPGNEQSINRIKNKLLTKEAIIITDRDAPIHVSGHPYRDEIRTILDWVKPLAVLPVHGERMQMERHAALAEDCGIQAPVIPINGDVIEINAKGLEKVGEVHAGMLAVEGRRLVEIDNESVLMRKRLMYHGSAVVTLVMNDEGELLAAPKITALGLFDEDNESDERFITGAIEAVTYALKTSNKHDRESDHRITETARIAARRYFEAEFDRKPQTRVHLVRV